MQKIKIKIFHLVENIIYKKFKSEVFTNTETEREKIRDARKIIVHFSYFLLLAKRITILHSKSSPIVRPVLLDLRQLKDDFKRANIRSRGTKKRKEKMERLCSSFEGPSLRMESWRNERHFTTLALLSPLFRPFSLSQLTFLANCFNCLLIKF